MTLKKRSYEDKVWPREVPRGGGCCIKVQRGVARVMDTNEGVVSPNTDTSSMLKTGMKPTMLDWVSNTKKNTKLTGLKKWKLTTSLTNNFAGSVKLKNKQPNPLSI